MNRINLDLSDLEAVLAVASEGTFKAAADVLHVSQPAVSARVRRAEDVLGVKLFHRTTRKVEITAHGERLRIRAEGTIAELRALVQEFKDEAMMRRGRVVLGATPSVAATVLPQVIKAFRRRHPAVEVALHDDFLGNALERVVAGDVDFALTPAHNPDPRIVLEPILREEILLVGPPDHPLVRRGTVSLASIAKHPLLLMPPTTALWGFLHELFGRHGLTLKVHMQLHHVLSIVALVHAGVGIAFLPRGLVNMLDPGSLCSARIQPRGLFRTISLTTARGRAIQPTARALYEEFRNMSW